MSNTPFRFAILKSKFNPEVTQGLLEGALHLLKENQITVSHDDLFEVPGAFEIPLIAKKLAQTKRYDGIIALGCVIKGDTAHFEFISLGATLGIQQAILETNTPIAFGILTTYTDEQAEVRAQVSDQGLPHNKGQEAALACLESARLLRKLS